MWICYCGAQAHGVAKQQCGHQVQFCYQKDVQDVEHLTPRTRRTCHPWSIKTGLAEVLLNVWLAEGILSVTLGLVLFPSTSPQSFTQRFCVLSLDWQPPTSHSQSPEVHIQSLPKDFNMGHQLLLPTFHLKACEPLACGAWGRSSLQIISGCEGNPSGAWMVFKPSLGLCSGPNFTLHTQLLAQKSKATQQLPINAAYLSYREHPHIGF